MLLFAARVLRVFLFNFRETYLSFFYCLLELMGALNSAGTTRRLGVLRKKAANPVNALSSLAGFVVLFRARGMQSQSPC